MYWNRVVLARFLVSGLSLRVVVMSIEDFIRCCDGFSKYYVLSVEYFCEFGCFNVFLVILLEFETLFQGLKIENFVLHNVVPGSLFFSAVR